MLSVHWGLLEDRVAIADYQREAAREFVDAGADLVLAPLGDKLRPLGVVREHPLEHAPQGAGVARGEAQADGALHGHDLAQAAGVGHDA